MTRYQLRMRQYTVDGRTRPLSSTPQGRTTHRRLSCIVTQSSLSLLTLTDTPIPHDAEHALQPVLSLTHLSTSFIDVCGSRADGRWPPISTVQTQHTTWRKPWSPSTFQPWLRICHKVLTELTMLHKSVFETSKLINARVTIRPGRM